MTSSIKDLRVRKLQLIEYKGTEESFNEIKEKCFNSDDYSIYFINEYGALTPRFCGDKFIVYPMQILYKKGDFLHYEISENI
jgi:hypothetical protein